MTIRPVSSTLIMGQKMVVTVRCYGRMSLCYNELHIMSMAKKRCIKKIDCEQ